MSNNGTGATVVLNDDIKKSCCNMIKDIVLWATIICIVSTSLSYVFFVYYLENKISVSVAPVAKNATAETVPINTKITTKPVKKKEKKERVIRREKVFIGKTEQEATGGIQILQLRAYTPYDNSLDSNGEFIMPPIKALCLQVADHYNGTTINPVSDNEIRKGLINGDRIISHLFYGMNIYLELHNKTCTAMHHFSGYSGDPRTMISIYLGGSKYINMINPVIKAASSSTKEKIFKNNLCKTGYKVSAPDYVVVEFRTTKNLLNIKGTRDEDPSFDEPMSISSQLTGDAALCFQGILSEIEKGVECKK